MVGWNELVRRGGVAGITWAACAKAWREAGQRVGTLPSARPARACCPVALHLLTPHTAHHIKTAIREFKEPQREAGQLLLGARRCGAGPGSQQPRPAAALKAALKAS